MSNSKLHVSLFFHVSICTFISIFTYEGCGWHTIKYTKSIDTQVIYYCKCTLLICRIYQFSVVRSITAYFIHFVFYPASFYRYLPSTRIGYLFAPIVLRKMRSFLFILSNKVNSHAFQIRITTEKKNIYGFVSNINNNFVQYTPAFFDTASIFNSYKLVGLK